MSIGLWETLTSTQGDGTAVTAASRTSMTAATTQARFTLPANKLKNIGDQLLLVATGRISNVVTTPGTARFDLAFGSNVVFDSQAMPLNTTAKTNVGWWLEALGTVRSVGTAATIFWQGRWQSESVIASAAAASGGSGSFVVPYNAAPAVGASFDSTVTQLVDLFFTQTVATGSCQLHQMNLSYLSATGF